MNRSAKAAFAAILVALPLAGCSVFGGKAADELRHLLLEREADFEVRRYAPYVLAQTTVMAPFEDAVRTGFRQLFKYISGDNRSKSKIEMTAPVLMEPRGERIEMTAPVFARSAPGVSREDEEASYVGQAWTVSFVLPADYSLVNAPAPLDRSVELVEMPARDVAVVRFSGRLNSKAAETNRARLATWLAAKGRPHNGDWELAGYNPPWTLPPFRRNEVLVTLK